MVLDSEVLSTLQTWVDNQLAPWRETKPYLPRVEQQFLELQTLPRFCVIQISDIGTVRIREKSNSAPDAFPVADVALAAARSKLYLQLIEDVVREHDLKLNLDIGLEVGDAPPTLAGVPLFCFQKPERSHIYFCRI
jgi:hypothetical protein